MNTKTIANGARRVAATRNDAGSPWHARLYVDGGSVATLIAGRFRSERGLAKWAAKVLAK